MIEPSWNSWFPWRKATADRSSSSKRVGRLAQIYRENYQTSSMRIQKEMDYEASRIDWNITSSFRHGQPFRRSRAACTERTLSGRHPVLTQQRKTIRSVHHQTRHDHVLRLPEADRCWGSESWIR